LEIILFRRQAKKKPASQSKPLKELNKMQSASQLLADEKRQELLAKMKAFSALGDSRFDSLCTVLIHNLTHYYQNLPETSNNYYSQPGGLIDHALNRTEAALSLFKQFVILEDSSEYSELQKLWQYALFSAGLLKGVGKLFVDFQINLYDRHGHFLKPWNPLLESLTTFGSYYDYIFEKESELVFRKRLNVLLARAVMPPGGFAWIASEPQVLAVWLALINEDERSAGTLGAILIRAEAIAIQRYYSRFMVKGGGGRTGRYGRIGRFTDTTPEALNEREQLIGVEFMQWLMEELANGRIQLNKPPLFMVPGGMLISPDMFKLFIRFNPDYKNWQMVQNGFLSLGLHEVGPGGTVTSRFEQLNNQQIHTGIVFPEYATVLPEQVQVYNMNTGKSSTRSALDVIHSAEVANQFIRSHTAPPGTSLDHLTANGEWKQVEEKQPSVQPGVKRSG